MTKRITALVFVSWIHAAAAQDCSLPETFPDFLTDETGHAPYILTQALQYPPRPERRYIMRFATSQPDMLIVVPREELPDDEEALRAAQDIAEQWARMPTIIHELWPPGGRLELDLDSHGSLNYTNGGIIKIGHDGTPWPEEGAYDTNAPWTDETLLHEAAHMLDADAGWYRPEEWDRAAERDGAHVSEYAETTIGEDFADSFVA